MWNGTFCIMRTLSTFWYQYFCTFTQVIYFIPYFYLTEYFYIADTFTKLPNVSTFSTAHCKTISYGSDMFYNSLLSKHVIWSVREREVHGSRTTCRLIPFFFKLKGLGSFFLAYSPTLLEGVCPYRGSAISKTIQDRVLTYRDSRFRYNIVTALVL